MVRLVAVLVLTLSALMFGQAMLAESHVRAPGSAVNLPDDDGPPNTLGTQSDGEFWADYRAGGVGIASSDTASPVPMQRLGQGWRKIRTEFLLKYLGWFPVGVFGLLALFFLIKGKKKIDGGRSGKTVPRFTLNARVAHWFMASVFILLAISGTIIMFGRPVIVPLLGHQINSILTSAAMQGHNLFGPLFILALLWMFVKFVRHNFFHIIDFKWIFKLGGLFGGHVSSGLFNFGEKSWFWLLIIVGIVMSVTGLALEFPWFVEDLRLLQLSTILHGIGAIALISVALGHIYMGTIGVEGAIDSMLIGEVDENWAKEHHDKWYEKVTGKSATDTPEEGEAP